MADPHALRRTEAAVVLLGLTAIAALLPVALDGARFHLASLVAAATGNGTVSMDSVASVAVACATTLCLLRFAASLLRRWRAQRRIAVAVGAKPRRHLDGIAYIIGPTPGLHVFTVGFLRPMIFVSDTAEGILSPDAFRAVLAHEASHVRRRDPLRLALAAALVDAFGWVPGVRGSAGQHATLAELAADAEAVRSTGDMYGLTQALLEMESYGPPGTGILPQRVDQLVGELRWEQASRLAVAAAFTVLLGLATVAIAIGVAPEHPAVFCAVAVFALAPVLLWPAGLAARRAGAMLCCR